jgi:hypothetical protein
MFEITELRNKGIGRQALIVGGGPSVKGFDFRNFVNTSTDIFVINDTIHLDIPITYNIYRDKTYRARLEKRIEQLQEKRIKIIAFSENNTPYANYFYNWHHFAHCYTHKIDYPIEFIHTGPDCLFVCDWIINYDKTFLIGLDYYADGEAVHYYGDEDPKSDYYADEKYRDMVKGAMFRNGIKDYAKVKWHDRITNLSEKSLLTREVLHANKM